MARPALLLLVVAALVAGADLAHKAAAVAARGDTLLYHDRSALYGIGIVLAASAWCAGIAVTRSAGLAVAGGLLLGGALGNALSLLLWNGAGGVPNPLVVGDASLGLAFNVADVAVAVAGLVVLPPAAVVYALRNRHRLRERVTLRA